MKTSYLTELYNCAVIVCLVLIVLLLGAVIMRSYDADRNFRDGQQIIERETRLLKNSIDKLAMQVDDWEKNLKN